MTLLNVSRGRAAARAAGIAIIVACGALGARPAAAEDVKPHGPSILGNVCMQEAFGPGKLNCTANDIRISKATPIDQESCIAGTYFDLKAQFDIEVTANARYDAGFFFRTDGGPDARGGFGDPEEECALNGLSVTLPLQDPTKNLDGDTCGDLNAGTQSVVFTIPNVLCAAADNSNLLRLPNCTSWHSNQGTACSFEGNDADAMFSEGEKSFFAPDTKSKCVCDDEFTVEILVETPGLTVVKSTETEMVGESGDFVMFTVDITNGGKLQDVTITSLEDEPYGDLLHNIPSDEAFPFVDNTCPELLDTVLAPGEMVTCEFWVFTMGTPGLPVVDEVHACASRDGVEELVCGSGEASVMVEDDQATPTLTKTVAHCTMDVTYDILVHNPSAVDSLTLTELVDDQFGDITVAGGDIVSTMCAVPQTIVPGGNYGCSFVATIDAGSCDVDHTNVVTAQVKDDDGFASAPSDHATLLCSAP